MIPSSAHRIGGPVPKFTDYHMWKTLMLLDTYVPLGRKKLSSLLGIGEGSTRTIISILQDRKYIDIGKAGIILTDKGNQYRNGLYFDVSPIMTSDLTINTCDCAVRIQHASKRITYGCEERDIAIKAGATGATTLVCINGKLVFPGSDYPVEESMETALKEKFDIRNDDVIVIGTAGDPERAECGAVTAALNIIGGLDLGKDLKNVMTARSSASEIMSLAFAVHDLIGGLPVCAKSRDNLGIRIENGVVVDNAYTGDVLEEAIEKRTTIRKIAETGPYKGTKVIVTPIELEGTVIAAIGVVDIRGIAQDAGLNPFTD